MNTPRLRWLIICSTSAKTYPVVVNHRIVEEAARHVAPPVLQQQVSDDRGVLTWVDVEVVYEERKSK